MPASAGELGPLTFGDRMNVRRVLAYGEPLQLQVNQDAAFLGVRNGRSAYRLSHGVL